MPLSATALTAATAPAVSSAVMAPPGVQLGRPSVASRMDFGLGSVSVPRYSAALWTARRVGVFPPGVVAAIAVAIAGAFFVSIGTATPACRLHAAPLAKYLRPHRRLLSVS